MSKSVWVFVGIMGLLLAGCFAQTGGDAEPECQCRFEGESGTYVIPCGATVCVGTIPAACTAEGEGRQLEGACDGDEVDTVALGQCERFGSGSCYVATDLECLADPRCESSCISSYSFFSCTCGYASGYSDADEPQCSRHRDASICDAMPGCRWTPAECVTSGEGCEAFVE